ncbi:putative nucleoporin [Talaromyces proteolyticus]|uniref:Nucleoporin n=1 Tax=Talaromyces proteolyticus TaxID=1131652 RepID=A0AAD4KYT3_9EURO|nr:putative nucleoporin [Talaromyces proteolyticus]KAH8704035.1 putative nucleoporin [Talaromyces proteolyticus]
MSLFGAQPQQQSGGLFANSTANKTPSLFGNTQQQSTGSSLFGNTQQNKPATGQSLFGSSANQPQQQTSGGLFGSTQTQNQPTGLFGGQQTQTQTQTQNQPQSGGLFGSTAQQKPAGSLFGGPAQQPQQPQQPQQTGTSFFGATNNALQQQQQQQQQQPQQQQSLFGGGSLFANQQQQTQQQPQPQPQLGQTMNQPQLGSSLWSPGRAVTGVHRTVPAQMEIIRDKWDPTNQTSPFRTYLYNFVGEDQAPFYQPSIQDDVTKWEEALKSRPEPGYVPVLVKGFWELGKRAQRQKDFLSIMQTRLHEINQCLTDLLSRHDLKISVKIADCRRKHVILSQRCLSLAAKTQVLRNRGYAMDDAEEELKKKLVQLERGIFDPSITGRAEEIWARMLAIREHSKRLAAEIERAGSNAANDVEESLDENVIKTAKKILEDYASQIQHLQKELVSINKELDEAQKAVGANVH